MEVAYIDRPGSCRILPVDHTTAGQVPHSAIPFSQVVKEFDLIIEIGYYWGGLTLWFEKNKKEGAKVIGYDIDDSHREVFDKKMDYRIADCFDPDTKQEIIDLIQNSGKTLLFCDGGNKDREFIEYCGSIKDGDVIMIHDYWDDSQPEPYNSFPESEGWAYGYEARYSDIEESILTNNLEGYYYEDFRKCLIGSFIRKDPSKTTTTTTTSSSPTTTTKK